MMTVMNMNIVSKSKLMLTCNDIQESTLLIIMADKSYEALLDEDKQPTNTNKEVEPTSIKVDPEEPKVSEPEPKEEVDEPVAKEPVEEEKEPVVEEPKEAVEETKPAEPESKAKAKEPSVERPVEQESKTGIEDYGLKGPKGVEGKHVKVNVDQDSYAAIKAAEDALKEAERKTLETYRSSLSGDVASRVQPSYAQAKTEPEPSPKAIKEAPVRQQVPEDKELASRIQPSYAQAKKEEEATPVEEPKPAEETPDDILAKLNLSPEKLAAVKAAMSDEQPEPTPKEEEPEPKAVYAAKKGDGKQVVVDGKQTAIDEPEQAPAQEEPVANPVPEPAENFDEKLDTFIHQADANYRKLFSFLTADERQRYIGATMALRNGEVNTKNILELDKLTTNALEVKEARNK